jgi:hypothetical protein
MNDSTHFAGPGFWCKEFKTISKFTKSPSEVTCDSCKKEMHKESAHRQKVGMSQSKLYFKTPEEFKAKCKVGDHIIDLSTKRSVTISAIGRDRFLYVDHLGVERVAQCASIACDWRPVEEVINAVSNS